MPYAESRALARLTFRSWSRSRIVCAIATVSMLGTRVSSQVPTYYAEFLGPVINASAMNASGQIVGSGTLANGTRGWVAGPGLPVNPLPLPPGYISSFANDINEAGAIAGVVSPTTYPEIGGEAALWTPASGASYIVTLLGKLPGHVRSMALGLNGVGDVVGYSSDGTFRIPVLFTTGGPVSLLSTGIFDPVSINDQRVLVDGSFTVKRFAATARRPLRPLRSPNRAAPPNPRIRAKRWNSVPALSAHPDRR